MFGNSESTQVSIRHALVFTDHGQERFSLARLFIGQFDRIFPHIRKLFANNHLHRVASFHLRVFLDDWIIRDCIDDSSLIALVSTRHVRLNAFFAADLIDFSGFDGV